jgi:hypothetical protein
MNNPIPAKSFGLFIFHSSLFIPSLFIPSLFIPSLFIFHSTVRLVVLSVNNVHGLSPFLCNFAAENKIKGKKI